MLSIFNTYCASYVALPVIAACKKQGLFALFQAEKEIQFPVLIKKLHANAGYLRIALHLLESLNWISQTTKDNYQLTTNAEPEIVPENILNFYQLPIDTLLSDSNARKLLIYWINVLLQHKTISSFATSLIEGAIFSPLFIALRQQQIHLSKDLFSNLDPFLRDAIIALFMRKGWVKEQNQIFILTEPGNQLIERAYIMGIAASYRPMLAKMPALLFGNFSQVFEMKRAGDEGHIDRALNVIASGFQHNRYFQAAEKHLLAVFNAQPVKNQPQYLADMGCGDGTFLKHVYTIIRDHTERGRMLEEYPLILLGIDYHEAALKEAAKALVGLPHHLIRGDIGDPEQLILDLKNNGVENTEAIFHMRSFLDHNFRYSSSDKHLQDASVFHLLPGGVYVDNQGNSLEPHNLINAWRQHFEKWSNIINSNNLLILEAHCTSALSPADWGKSESFYFDYLHAFSGQYLIDAEVFLVLAANVGLFTRMQPTRYPKSLPFCRVTISLFEKHEYKIRHACLEDLEVLQILEERCWMREIQTPQHIIAERLRQYPQGQFVLELKGNIIGVIYSQRIDNEAILHMMTADTAHTFHQAGGHIVQLLAVNILPEMQSQGLGDQLLEFMLQRCSVMSGIKAVVGITRCKNYHKQEKALIDYIEQRTEQGYLFDPILRFHELHGAYVKGLLPGYRPKDIQNEGQGVLIYYDIHLRERQTPFADITPKNAEQQQNTFKEAISNFLEKSIKSFLEPENVSGFSQHIPLMELGLDSADLLELSVQISDQYSVKLMPVFFFQYNTSAKISCYLWEQLNIANTVADSHQYEQRFTNSKSKKSDKIKDIASNKNREIAIIGIACRLPGGIDSLDKLWNLLRLGRSAINELPRGRWQWPLEIDPTCYHSGINRGGFLEEIDCFDATFFRLSRKEVQLMDPQQRLLMELSWEALEDAGYSPEVIRQSDTGVFVGASGSDYRLLLEQMRLPIESRIGIGNSMAMLANRLSYFYDFYGPSMQLDTACSSSLVALHEAVRSLQSGQCSQALVGGINIMCHPANTIAYYKAGMLSEDGNSRPFDEKANGYVRAEGGIVILIKPLKKAIHDQDPIYAVIKGISCNHGGQASSLTAPNPQQQSRLLQKALQDAQITPAAVSYIETHGTGTPLGDPIEICGLKEAFATFDSKLSGPHCGLGSIKSNLGHLEAAAGLAGLLKVVLSLKHKQLIASINFVKLNPQINFADSPFYIVEKNKVWSNHQDGNPRRAGVSSFGSGGTNAHVILEEYIPSKQCQLSIATLKSFDSVIILLSAKNLDRLKVYAEKLLKYIQCQLQEQVVTNRIQLTDLAYTLQVGREAMTVRLGFIAKSFEELEEKLQAFIKSRQKLEDNYRSQIQPEKVSFEELLTDVVTFEKTIDLYIEKNDLEKLLALWVKGSAINWEKLYKRNNKPNRIHLPTYPFSRERHWISDIG